MPEVTLMSVQELTEIGIEGAIKGIRAATLKLEADAKKAETAIATGTLQGSIQAAEPEVIGDSSIEARVSTGEEADAYAAYIHEGHRKDGTHIIAAYPEGLQYLRKPLLDNADEYRRIIEAGYLAAFR